MIRTYQKKLNGKNIGVVFGTFAPLHQGHLDLIMQAKKECDGGCMVIVDGRDGDRGGKEMPLRLRYRYIREFFADDDLVAVYPINETELGIEPYPNGWNKFINEVERIYSLGANGSAVFYVSEDEYYEHLNELGYEVVLMVWRYREQWEVWIVIDVASLVMFAMLQQWSMVVMYVAWTINAFYGWYNWSKLTKANSTT